MSITLQQIRAARGLLGWSQGELAGKAKLSQKAITNIELGATTPHAKTVQAIRTAFEMNGVEFLGHDGVRIKQSTLEIYELEGPDALRRFYDDVLETLKDGDGYFRGSGIDERRFMAYPEETKYYFERAARLNIQDRILLKKGDTAFLSPPECYRWVDSEYFGQAPIIVYRDKMAIIQWEPQLRIVIIHSSAAAETFRRQFESVWERAMLTVSDL